MDCRGCGCVLLLLLPLAVKTNYVLILIDQSLINVICVLGLNYITGLTGQTNLGMELFSSGSVYFGAAVRPLRSESVFMLAGGDSDGPDNRTEPRAAEPEGKRNFSRPYYDQLR